MRNPSSFLLVVLALLPACDKLFDAAEGRQSATPEALCSSDLGRGPGNSASLRERQAKLREKDTLAAWVAVGHAFVQSARTHALPALYLNAQGCADVALARDPRSSAALNLRALVWLNEHRFAEVEALAERALAADPDDPMLWGTLSDAKLELGKLEAAVDAAQRMMDLKPNLPSYGRAAHLRWLQGDATAAKAIYKQAIHAGAAYDDPEPAAWMITQAALVFWHEGDYPGADAGYDAALARVPKYAPALEGKGRVALSRGDYRAAARLLERALAAHESVENAWLLGDAYSLLGDRGRAEQAYARVVRDGERFDPRTLALYYATKNREPKAAVRLARAEYEKRKDPYSKDALAFALYRAGNLAEAERLSREAIAFGTRDARLLYHAGLVQIASGRGDEGRALEARALALNPRFDAWFVQKEHAL